MSVNPSQVDDSDRYRVRLGGTDDDAEVLRLAYLMWEMGLEVAPAGPEPDWRADYTSVFDGALRDGTMRAFVVDDPDEPSRLVACGIAWVYRLLPAPWLLNGKVGYLQWFSTEPDHRGRGLATRVLEASRDWLLAEGCTRIHLHATPSGEQMYRALGFSDSYFPNLWYSAPGSDV